MKIHEYQAKEILRGFGVAVHVLVMAGMIIKMLTRWTMNLKYVVAIPEFFFNI